MGIHDNSPTLPITKSDARPISTPLNETVVAADINAFTQSIADLRSFLSTTTLNAKDFGATGNGTTDDTAALSTMLASASPGTVVTIPPGTYKISSFLHITQPNVYVIGYGAKIVQTGAAQLGILVDNAPGVVVEGLWLYNNLPNGGWTGGSVNILGIRFYQSDDCKLINCRIENWGEGQVSLDASNRTFIFGNRLIGVGAAGGLVGGSDFNFGIYGETDNNSGAKILYNEISEAVHGVFLGNGWQDVLVQGNQVHDMIGQHGIYIDGGSGLRILGNSVRSCAGSGIKVQITAGATADTTGLVIEGNSVNTMGGVGILVIPAIFPLTYRFKSPVISGNTVRNCSQDGIIIDQADDWLVANNTVDTCTLNGIRMGTGSPAGFSGGHGRLLGNAIANVQQNGISGHLASSSSFVWVQDNTLTDVALAGAGYSAINLNVGYWNLVQNSIINSSTPTYDYHVNVAAGASYTIDGLWTSPSLTLKTINGLGTLGGEQGTRAVINLADWGAQGDSSIDNTAVFAAAIAALPNGGIIRVPPGWFKTNCLIATSNITIEGTSAKLFGGSTQNTTLSPANPAIPVIQVGDGSSNVEYCLLSNMLIVGDSSNATGDGVYIFGANYVTLDNIQVSNFGRYNVNMSSSVSQGTAFISLNHHRNLNFGKSGTGAGLNIDYGASSTEYIFVLDAIFNDGGSGGSPTAPAIQMNGGTFADLTNVFVSGSGASPGDPFGRSGGIHISGSPFNGPTLNMESVHIDSPTGGSVDELVVIDAAASPISSFIVGNWSCDGICNFTTDDSIVDLRGSEHSHAISFGSGAREFWATSAPSGGNTPYRVGDRGWNSTPVPGGPIGWVCTQAGAFANSGAWTALTSYTRGDDTHAPQSVTHLGNVYLCVVSGTSAGSGGPTGTGTNITDGSCHWRYLGPTPPVFKEFGLISI